VKSRNFFILEREFISLISTECYDLSVLSNFKSHLDYVFPIGSLVVTSDASKLNERWRSLKQQKKYKIRMRITEHMSKKSKKIKENLLGFCCAFGLFYG